MISILKGWIIGVVLALVAMAAIPVSIAVYQDAEARDKLLVRVGLKDQVSTSNIKVDLNKPVVDNVQRIDEKETALLIHKYVNEERAQVGLPALEWDDKLSAVALSHSQDMAERNYFSHETPEGKDHRDRYDENNINCFRLLSNNTYDNGSENLVKGDQPISDEDIARRAVNSWLESTKGHKENILSKYWTEEGIGVIIGNDAYYVTQNFC